MGRIYGAYDESNWMWYVGKESGKRFSRRKAHERDAIKGGTCYFQKALHKRLGVFVWSVLEDNVSNDKLDEREIWWIELNLDERVARGVAVSEGKRKAREERGKVN